MWKTVFFVALLTSPVSTLIAGEINSADLTRFDAGTPAKADEVNNNFTNLANAVNDNNSRLNEVEQNKSSGMLDHALTGTMTAGGIEVLGSGTLFKSELHVGDAIKIAEEVFSVATIVSDTQLTLDKEHSVGALNATAFTDSDLLLIEDGNKKNRASIDRSGNLSVNGYFTRKLYTVSGIKNEDLDDGRLASRTLSFTKRLDQTRLRIGYSDNLRVYRSGGAAAACSWEIRIDGESCPTGIVKTSLYISSGSTNIHRQASMFGYCDNIAPGSHEVQVWVTSNAEGAYAGADCSTGWLTTWALEVEEIM